MPEREKKITNTCWGAPSETRKSEDNPYCYPRYNQTGTIKNSTHLTA